MTGIGTLESTDGTIVFQRIGCDDRKEGVGWYPKLDVNVQYCISGDGGEAMKWWDGSPVDNEEEGATISKVRI